MGGYLNSGVLCYLQGKVKAYLDGLYPEGINEGEATVESSE